MTNSPPSGKDIPTTAALVLGAAVLPGARPSIALERRARHGAALWLEGRVQVVIGCGGVGRHPPSEAEMIAQICGAEGVPKDAILNESRSTNTLQNIAFALPLIAQAGIDEVVLVTDGYHAPRARLIARRLGLSTRSASPTVNDARWRHLRWRLREVPAWLYYRFWPGAFG
ncbi:YdcF family protein [Tropicimonas isoalkanivorans]|uniref:DUF218 domain-containing protein n=1 Tax=Tropicimonas isoalkanivorans TaxID=441112 RepID=A0A1I1NHY2_9RHOB|nr:YdcF family protein [Tropicimonas isoalkanivorans]SFC97137.1 DUF218 domain-containing protein [Tropicimonas isoalkanivorans]